MKAPALVLAGGKSDQALQRGAAAVAGVLPRAEHRILPGLRHDAVVMSPKSLAPVLIDFLRARRDFGPVKGSGMTSTDGHEQRQAEPDAAMKSLARLVGTWQVTGGAVGRSATSG